MLGSLDGQFEGPFAKLATLHAKNHFSFALITGNLFSGAEDDESTAALLSGAIQVPLPTYFTVGTTPLPAAVIEKIQRDDSDEICPNLHFLGKRSITKTLEGIRIVALGGKLDAEIVGGQSKEQHLPFHTADDAKALKGANSTDILLTALWPQGIWTGSKITLGVEPHAIPSTEGIAELCAALKPRYHFAASPADFFFEREPFIHPNEGKDKDPGPVAVTRFISMAPYGNAKKAKAMYAFSLAAASDAAVQVPPGATASPLAARAPRKRQHVDEGFSRFSNGHAGPSHHGHKRRRQDRSPPPGPDRCFFCLSNPNLPTHMVCSIGDESYLTIAKGPLPTPTTWEAEGLPFPGHVIIIPLSHAPTIPAMNVAEDPKAGERVYAEMTRFRESLQAMISDKSKHTLGAVTWEISRSNGIHLHWQLIPVPIKLIRPTVVPGGLVEAGFRIEAADLAYPSFQARELSLEEAAAGNFFRVWIWSDDGDERIKCTSLVMRLDPDARFDLQYPRRVMAKLLGLDARRFWQDVAQTEEEETRDVAALREAFRDWDFTMRGEDAVPAE